MKRAMIVVGIFVTLCLMSAIAEAAVPFKHWVVDLDVNQNKGEITATVVDGDCKKGKGKKGCIRFEIDHIGLITFSTDKKTQICSDNYKKWVISKVELSDKGYLLPAESPSTTPTISDKGIFEDSPNLPDWLEDAFPQLVKSTGVLYEASADLDGVTQVTRLNLNNNNATLGAKDIWYRVTVAKCGTEPVEVMVTDPRFENDGTTPN